MAKPSRGPAQSYADMIEMIGFFSRYAAFTFRQSLATALCDQGKDEESRPYVEQASCLNSSW